jgi:hypothetical protein
MRASIRSEEAVMTKQILQSRREVIRDCPVCVSGLLTLSEGEGVLDIYTCIACGTSVSLRQRTPKAARARPNLK